MAEEKRVKESPMIEKDAPEVTAAPEDIRYMKEAILCIGRTGAETKRN